jgi:hypothetical protein
MPGILAQSIRRTGIGMPCLEAASTRAFYRRDGPEAGPVIVRSQGLGAVVADRMRKILLGTPPSGYIHESVPLPA